MQRTRERLTERAARLALAFVLACGLMLPTAALMARPDQAWAADETVTLVNDTQPDVSYKAWQIFTAIIGVNDKAEQLKWSTTTDVRSAVLGYLDTVGYPAWLYATNHTKVEATNAYTGPDTIAHDDPQNAAEFINLIIAGGSYTNKNSVTVTFAADNDAAYGAVDRTQVSGTGVNNETVYSKTGSSYAWGLANALTKANVSTSYASTTSAGITTFTAPEGFYLIVADTETIGDSGALDEAGTAPIWLPLGGSTASITVKTSSAPTVDIKAFDDKDGTSAWTSYADANTGQDVWYRIIGTLPANYASYPSFAYKITDTLTGLEPSDSDSTSGADVGDVHVYVLSAGTEFSTTDSTLPTGDGVTEITGSLAGATGSITWNSGSSGAIVVDIANLKDSANLNGALPTSSSKIAVYYKAHLTSAATMGSSNPNTSVAQITYSADPLLRGSETSLTTDNTTTSTANTFAYRLVLNKYDKSNGESLNGAVFTVQVADTSSDTGSRGKYVQADGSLGSTAANFTTASGYISPTNVLYTTAEYTTLAASFESVDRELVATLAPVSYIEIPRVDEGTYVIHETTPPSADYDTQDADITIVVASTYDADERPTTITPTFSGGETQANVNDELLGSRLGYYNITEGANGHYNNGVKVIDTSTDPDTTYSAVNPSIGTITMMTVDPKMIKMPLTGLPGYVGIAILGLVLVVCGFGGIFALRRVRAKRDLD